MVFGFTAQRIRICSRQSKGPRKIGVQLELTGVLVASVDDASVLGIFEQIPNLTRGHCSIFLNVHSL